MLGDHLHLTAGTTNNGYSGNTPRTSRSNDYADCQMQKEGVAKCPVVKKGLFPQLGVCSIERTGARSSSCRLRALGGFQPEEKARQKGWDGPMYVSGSAKGTRLLDSSYFGFARGEEIRAAGCRAGGEGGRAGPAGWKLEKDDGGRRHETREERLAVSCMSP